MNRRATILARIGQCIGKPLGWERIVRLFASPEKCAGMSEICIVRNDIIFLAQPSVELGWHVAFFGTYEPELRDIFRAVLSPGSVAMDVGANVGWHTLLIAQLVGELGRVLAVEANPSVRDRLLDNVYLNRFDQVDVIPYALADADGRAEFYGPCGDVLGSGSGHIARDCICGQDIIEVETRRLDGLVEGTGIQRLDLIKIDVEGFEWPVLRGAERTITQFRPHVLFEYDANYSSRGGGDPEKIFQFFSRHHYRVYAVGRTCAEHVEVANWPTCANLWAIPTRTNADGVGVLRQ